MLTACTTETSFQEVEDITGSTDPMTFTVTRESQMHSASTRASQPLTSGFMVSCYKHYDTANQQTVMPRYEVRYHTTGTAWDGTTRAYWTYDDVAGQFLRYWDYSAFPYRFHAIAPYPDNTEGYVLDDRTLTIPCHYSYQTCINGMATPADKVAEPHLISQVLRDTDGTDHDLLLVDPTNESELNNGSTTKSRDVWMPFHHLNSKIRFGVYHSTAWLTANKTYIQDLTISVTSPHFATEATGYNATGTDSWRILTGNAGFTGVTTLDAAPEVPHRLFRFDGGPDIPGNDITHCQTRATAFMLQCPAGIMQIPQEQVGLMVSFDLMNDDGTLNQRFTDVPVRLELDDHPGTYQYSFDWRSGFIYTYYLIIGEVNDKLEITFTATLAPWEDIAGSLTTDLEQ